MGDIGNVFEFLLEMSVETDCQKDLGIHGKIILKYIVGTGILGGPL